MSPPYETLFEMATLTLFVVLFVGEFIENDAAYNPKMTYSVRFKKVSLSPNLTGTLVIDQFRDVQFVNGNVTINSNEVVDQVEVVIHRCKLEGIDCEYFQAWKLKDICPKLREKYQVWSRWYSSYNPPMRCPVDRGPYDVVNGTLDVERLVRWYSDVLNYEWKVAQKYYAGDNLVGGFTMQFSVFGYRKRSAN